MGAIYGTQGSYSATPSTDTPEVETSGWKNAEGERKSVNVKEYAAMMKAQVEQQEEPKPVNVKDYAAMMQTHLADTHRLFKIKQEHPHLTPEQQREIFKMAHLWAPQEKSVLLFVPPWG